MRWIVRVCRNLLKRNTVDRELDEELRAVRDLLVDERRGAGMSEEAAERAVRRELGSLDSIKDSVRDVRAGAFVETLLRDVCYGARLLVRNPLFAATAVASLSIGIGATTTIFTVAEALLLRPPAGVAQPDRVVDIGSASDGFRLGTVSYSNYLEIQQRASTLQHVYAYPVWPSPMALGTHDGVERVYGDEVTPNYFAALGAIAVQGRAFDARDGSAVVVLSHRLWLSRFGGDPAVVGRLIRLNGNSFTVTGVAAPGFQGTTIRRPDLWIPVRSPAETPAGHRATASFLLGARLKPGVTHAQASAEISALGLLLQREFPEENRGFRLRAARLSMSPDMRGPLGIFLGFLFAIVATILAVACTNLTGILFARGVSRRREFAMRVAIGAAPSRIVRQLLVETLLLFGVACLGGLVVARWGTALLVLMLPSVPVPVGVSLALDSRAFLFAAAVSLIAALLSGVLPARHAARLDLTSSMRGEPSLEMGRMRLRSVFVIAQVALSTVLVVVGGLFAHALQEAASRDPGFGMEAVEVSDLDLSIAQYTDTSGLIFGRELLSRMRALPGIAAATLAFAPPGAFEGLGLGIWVQDSENGGRRSFDAAGNIVSPGYFDTLRIPLRAGRDFSTRDIRGAQRVAIISETTARRFWPGRDPGRAIGEVLFRASASGQTMPVLVVGVAGDVSQNSLIDGTRDLFVYLPWDQEYLPRVSIVTRSVDGRRLRPSVAQSVAELNSNLPIVSSAALEDRVRAGLTPHRVVATLAGSLGLLGLLLSGIGVYGVTAYAVTVRTREIAVRLALGARRSHIVSLVVGQGLILVGIGALIGLIIATGASQLLAALLADIPGFDPISFAGAVLLFGVTALAACYWPLRRAMHMSIADGVRFE
jgi:predicted permease